MLNVPFVVVTEEFSAVFVELFDAREKICLKFWLNFNQMVLHR